MNKRINKQWHTKEQMLNLSPVAYRFFPEDRNQVFGVPIM
jgi:hypothetical protein